MKDDRLLIMIEVTGASDYLPSFAGNLDIINASCIQLCNSIQL